MAQAGVHVRQADRGHSVIDYWRLVSLILVSALAALAIVAGSGQTTMRSFMHAYMGVFLIFFALLKIFDLEGFKDGFAMYDLIAMLNSTWGYVYPFIELALGLALSRISLATYHLCCDHHCLLLRRNRRDPCAAQRSRYRLPVH